MLATREHCPDCGRENRSGASSCADCGRRLPGDAADRLTAEDLRHRTRPYVSFKERAGHTRSEEYFSLKNSLISMVIGAFFCWWDSMGGIGSTALHFIGALTHEIGHAATATLFGAPSFPVISMNGHAAALHKGQYVILALGIWAFFAYMAFAMRREQKTWKPFAWAAVVYPLIAFTGLWRPLFLLAGHGGELVFAGIFFWRAWTGGFTSSLQERYLYASLAWFLTVDNAVFHFRLMTSAQYRAGYHGNGSFGLVNDYIRVADGAGVTLPTVAAGMLFVNVVVLPVALWFAIRQSSETGVSTPR